MVPVSTGKKHMLVSVVLFTKNWALFWILNGLPCLSDNERERKDKRQKPGKLSWIRADYQLADSLHKPIAIANVLERNLQPWAEYGNHKS